MSNGDLFEANMKLIIADRADEVVLLADHTKFQTKGLYPNVATGKIHTIVTDSGTDDEVLAAYRSIGIQTMLGVR